MHGTGRWRTQYDQNVYPPINSGLLSRYKGALLYGVTLYVLSARQNAPGTFKCPGHFTSLHSEQGTESLAPLGGYLLKAKGVTTKVTPFANFTILRTPL